MTAERTPLPVLDGHPRHDLPRWHYPAWSGSDGGWCRLRVWQTPGPSRLLAVVTELRDDNPGVSVTNAAEYIHTELTRKYGNLVLFEHYPADPASPLVAWVRIVSGHAEWAPVWPLAGSVPEYPMHRLWWDLYGQQITGTKTTERER